MNGEGAWPWCLKGAGSGGHGRDMLVVVVVSGCWIHCIALLFFVVRVLDFLHHIYFTVDNTL